MKKTQADEYNQKRAEITRASKLAHLHNMGEGELDLKAIHRERDEKARKQRTLVDEYNKLLNERKAARPMPEFGPTPESAEDALVRSRAENLAQRSKDQDEQLDLKAIRRIRESESKKM